MTNTIDLSKLPPPAIIETLDFETVLAGMRAKLLQLHPAAADVIDLESEPLQKLLQVGAYQDSIINFNYSRGSTYMFLLWIIVFVTAKYLVGVLGKAQRRAAGTEA